MHARRSSIVTAAAAREAAAREAASVMSFNSKSGTGGAPQSFSTVVGKLLPRRTLTASKVRSFAAITLACISLVATTFVMHAWFFAPPPAVHLHHQYNLQMIRRDQQQYMPSSRVFKHKSDGHVRSAATPASAWSFAQHPDAELGALIGFLAALASNSLPLTIDPSQHIDPELVLGFNTHTGDEKVQAEVENIVDDTWMRNPVVIFSELHSTAAPLAREAKTIIGEYRLYPAPTVFEVDQRVDAAVLRPLVRRLTGAEQLPVVLVAGRAYASIEALRAARDDGSLATAISKSAATIDGALVRRKKHH